MNDVENRRWHVTAAAAGALRTATMI